MNDPRTESSPRPSLTLGSIGEVVGGRVVGDQDLEVSGIAPAGEAGEAQIAFLASRRYLRRIAGSQCAAYLVSAELEAELAPDTPRVVVDAPYPALRTLLQQFFPAEERTPGIHPTAVIGHGVRFGSRVSVGPYAVLQDRVQVGDDVIIGAHSVLGAGTVIGARTRLYPHVVAYDDCVIGDDVIVHSGARLGADGFGYTQVDGERHKMPQVGRCVIGDGVEIGANTTIDRGSLGDTVIGEGVKIDNLVQIAHNVRVGARSLIAALVGVAGSTRIGKNVWLGGQAGVINQLEIGDGARVVVASTVMRDVPAGETVSGHPARPHREDLRRQARLGRLSHLKRRVERLEEEMRRLSSE